MQNPWKDDPFREYFSRFASGLEQFYDSLIQFHLDHSTGGNTSSHYSRAVRCSILHLAIQSFVLQTALNFVASIIPQNCTSFNQLFYPTVLLVRYLYPDPWDELFMSTVRALGCETRSDMVARPGPRYFVQLRQYLRRTVKAYFAIGAIHWLVNREGALARPMGSLVALVVVQQYLRYKGLRYTEWKLLAGVVMVGPQWTVWLVQVAAQQQMFLYELLQPYLVRTQFKQWEERAWWDEHEIELRGFALGVWILCSVPYIGVTMIPLMFASVPFLLSRSCGLMENSVHGLSGDLLERRTPGLKAVALGKSQAVRGDWDAVAVETFVKGVNPALQGFKPSRHAKTDKDGDHAETHYMYEQGIGSAVNEEQIRADQSLARIQKRDLLREHQMQLQVQRQRLKFQHREQQRQIHTQHQHLPFASPSTVAAASTTPGLATRNASDARSEDQMPPLPSVEDPLNAYRLEELMQYDFSDRKSADTVPSAPPMNYWNQHHSDMDVFRTETMRAATATEAPAKTEMALSPVTASATEALSPAPSYYPRSGRGLASEDGVASDQGAMTRDHRTGAEAAKRTERDARRNADRVPQEAERTQPRSIQASSMVDAYEDEEEWDSEGPAIEGSDTEDDADDDDDDDDAPPNDSSREEQIPMKLRNTSDQTGRSSQPLALRNRRNKHGDWQGDVRMQDGADRDGGSRRSTTTETTEERFHQAMPLPPGMDPAQLIQMRALVAFELQQQQQQLKQQLKQQKQQLKQQMQQQKQQQKQQVEQQKQQVEQQKQQVEQQKQQIQQQKQQVQQQMQLVQPKHQKQQQKQQKPQKPQKQQQHDEALEALEKHLLRGELSAIIAQNLSDLERKIDLDWRASNRKLSSRTPHRVAHPASASPSSIPATPLVSLGQTAQKEAEETEETETKEKEEEDGEGTKDSKYGIILEFGSWSRRY